MQNYFNNYSGFKRTIKWNNYESNIKRFAQNEYLNHLINPSFQGVTDFLYYLLRMKIIDIGTHWLSLCVHNNNNNVIYFNSFGVEHIPKEIKAFINRPSSSASIIKT